MGAEPLFTGARGITGRTIPHADRDLPPQCQLFRSCGVAEARRLVAVGVEDRDDPVERVKPGADLGAAARRLARRNLADDGPLLSVRSVNCAATNLGQPAICNNGGVRRAGGRQHKQQMGPAD
jgi:hypothetical protein